MTRWPVLTLSVVASMSVGSNVEARARNVALPLGTTCGEAWSIFAVVAEEGDPKDTLLSSPPEFLNVALPTAAGAKLVRLTPKSTWWRGNWTGERPSRDHIRRWFAAPYRSIATCLGKSGSNRTLRKVSGWKAASRRRPGGLHYRVQASYPVMDASRSHALLVYSAGMAAGLGKSELVLLERVEGEWRRVGAGLISVS